MYKLSKEFLDHFRTKLNFSYIGLRLYLMARSPLQNTLGKLFLHSILPVIGHSYPFLPFVGHLPPSIGHPRPPFPKGSKNWSLNYSSAQETEACARAELPAFGRTPAIGALMHLSLMCSADRSTIGERMIGDLYVKLNRCVHAIYCIVDWKEQRIIY